MKLKRNCNWRYCSVGFVSILFAFWIVFVVVNTFAVDFTDDYKKMSQSFEKNREVVYELLNSNTKIDMHIGKNNEYRVYSDEYHSINVTLSDDKYIFLEKPSIQYPVAINNETYMISEEYKISEDADCQKSVKAIILIFAGIIISILIILFINILLEKLNK